MWVFISIMTAVLIGIIVSLIKTNKNLKKRVRELHNSPSYRRSVNKDSKVIELKVTRVVLILVAVVLSAYLFDATCAMYHFDIMSYFKTESTTAVNTPDYYYYRHVPYDGTTDNSGQSDGDGDSEGWPWGWIFFTTMMISGCIGGLLTLGNDSKDLDKEEAEHYERCSMIFALIGMASFCLLILRGLYWVWYFLGGGLAEESEGFLDKLMYGGIAAFAALYLVVGLLYIFRR